MNFDTILIDTPQERAEADRALLAKQKEAAVQNFNAQLASIQADEDKLAELEAESKLDNPDWLKSIATYRAGIMDGYENARKALADIDAAEQALNTPDAVLQTLDLNTKPPQREWLIQDWLPENYLSMLTGKGGVGKSYLALQVAAVLAMGTINANYSKPTIDRVFHKGGAAPNTSVQSNTVWAAWEDDSDEIRRRLGQIQRALEWPTPGVLSSKIKYIDLKMLGPIWGPEMSEHVSVRGSLLRAGYQLTKICEDVEAKLLVLDPCAGAFGGNENDRSAVRQFTAYLNGWCAKSRCTCLLLAHPPKNDSTYSGSTDWLGSVRSLWNLSLESDEVNTKEKDDNGKQVKVKESYYSLTHEKSNYSMRQTERFLTKVENSGVWLEVGNKEEASFNAKAKPTEQKNKEEPDDDPF